MPENNSATRRWATLDVGANYLQVSKRGLRLMADDGRVKLYRLGGRCVRVDLNEIDRMMAEG